MALIKCPECGKEISDKAAACPNCGAPIAAGKTVPVRIWRERKFTGSALSGNVLIDGQTVGSAASGTDFVINLSTGEHNILLQSVSNDKAGIYETYSKSLIIPDDAKDIDIELYISKPSASRVFFGAGQAPRVEIKDIHINN